MKAAEEHVVRLSKQALLLLELQVPARSGDLIFVSVRRGLIDATTLLRLTRDLAPAMTVQIELQGPGRRQRRRARTGGTELGPSCRLAGQGGMCAGEADRPPQARHGRMGRVRLNRGRRGQGGQDQAMIRIAIT
jgi:hypothetical protein